MSNSRGSGMLITGVLFFFLAGLFAAVSVVSWTSLQRSISAEPQPTMAPVTLSVEAPTVIELKPGKYAIWADDAQLFESTVEEADFDSDDFFDEEPDDTPEDGSSTTQSDLHVTIDGPVPVEVSPNKGTMRINNERQIASFEITEPGEYTVSASLPDEVSHDTQYTVGNDAMAVVGEVGTGIMKFMLIVTGGGCGGVLGFIGLILVMLHVIRR